MLNNSNLPINVALDKKSFIIGRYFIKNKFGKIMDLYPDISAYRPMQNASKIDQIKLMNNVMCNIKYNYVFGIGYRTTKFDRQDIQMGITGTARGLDIKNNSKNIDNAMRITARRESEEELGITFDLDKLEYISCCSSKKKKWFIYTINIYNVKPYTIGNKIIDHKINKTSKDDKKYKVCVFIYGNKNGAYNLLKNLKTVRPSKDFPSFVAIYSANNMKIWWKYAIINGVNKHFNPITLYKKILIYHEKLIQNKDIKNNLLLVENSSLNCRLA